MTCDVHFETPHNSVFSAAPGNHSPDSDPLGPPPCRSHNESPVKQKHQGKNGVNQHANWKPPCSIGNTSSNDGFSIAMSAMLDYRSVTWFTWKSPPGKRRSIYKTNISYTYLKMWMVGFDACFSCSFSGDIRSFWGGHFNPNWRNFEFRHPKIWDTSHNFQWRGTTHMSFGKHSGKDFLFFGGGSLHGKGETFSGVRLKGWNLNTPGKWGRSWLGPGRRQS